MTAGALPPRRPTRPRRVAARLRLRNHPARHRRAKRNEVAEIAVWLAIAETAFAFWYNEVDDDYNAI